jgi:hypothetical protein
MRSKLLLAFIIVTSMMGSDEGLWGVFTPGQKLQTYPSSEIYQEKKKSIFETDGFFIDVALAFYSGSPYFENRVGYSFDKYILSYNGSSPLLGSTDADYYSFEYKVLTKSEMMVTVGAEFPYSTSAFPSLTLCSDAYFKSNDFLYTRVGADYTMNLFSAATIGVKFALGVKF